MANIATCPECARQLGLPSTIASTDRAECPECHAVFTLRETVQISLPVARIVDRVANQTTVASDRTRGLPAEQQSALNENRTERPADAVPPRRNWEERLKKALARDVSEVTAAPSRHATDDASLTESRAPEVRATRVGDSSSSPGLELDLDLRTPADGEGDCTKTSPALPVASSGDPPPAEPVERQADMLTKTLADFAAAVDASSTDTKRPVAKRSATPHDTDTVSTTSEPTVAGDLSQRVALSEELDLATTPSAGRVRPCVPRTTSEGRGFPKFAALVVGPVLGSLWGLYGLLWLQGAEADYVGLSRVLPDSILPADLRGSGENSALAGANNAEDPMPEAEATSLLAAPEGIIHSQRSPAPIRRDASVLPASLVQGVAPAGSSTSNSTATAPTAMRSKVKGPTFAGSMAEGSMAEGSMAQGSTAEGSTARSRFDEFCALVDDAAAAMPDFFAGDLSKPESIRSKGQAYISLCRLAEHFDFAQQPLLAPAVEAKARQARQLYQSVTSQANFRQDLSRIAARWWGYQQRPNPGIFLAGQVQETQPVGTGSLCWLKISAHSAVDSIPVLLSHQRYRTGDRIGVVGRVVSSPHESLAGFGAQAAQKVAAYYDYQLGIDR